MTDALSKLIAFENKCRLRYERSLYSAWRELLAFLEKEGATPNWSS